MLAEALIAARGFNWIQELFQPPFRRGGHSSNSTHVKCKAVAVRVGGFGAGFASGGLAGVIGRKVTNNAVKQQQLPQKQSLWPWWSRRRCCRGIGGHIYTSSVSKGGNFANNVIGSVATGNITQMGTISGEKAVDALHSYMGHAALEAGAEEHSSIPECWDRRRAYHRHRSYRRASGRHRFPECLSPGISIFAPEGPIHSGSFRRWCGMV